MTVIKVKGQRLTEAVKRLDTMSDSEFDSILDGVLDRIDSVKKVKYSTDLDSRVQKIQNDMNDPFKNKDLEQEDRANRGVDRRIAKTREREKEKYAPKTFKGLAELTQIIYRSIADQVDAVEDDEETYAVLNKRADEDPSVVKRGERIDDVFDTVPTVDIYFDQSGSWGESDLEMGAKAISHLRYFEERGEIILNIFYFADNVTSIKDDVRGATGAWPRILEKIKETGANNVLVMSDDDIESQSNPQKPVWVDGCVWFLWRNGCTSPRCVKELIGKRNRNSMNQFSFSPEE